MRIYSMTATFGKLEHETLTLEPGLNVLTAPNEWGKSTWCAFLCAMLYGLETRVHTTKNALADKERYAPWSGSPMSGSIDLCWQGRDITIQRRTKGRVPMGEFTAFETHTGLPVPELTAANCGVQLLGVEKSVFQRAGFIRLSDMPVTQDESLRQRLNALVTTGDDSGTAQNLARQLKELKNRCRSNRTTGLLPQALAEREALENTLSRLRELQGRCEELQCRQAQLAAQQAALENHRDALLYAQSCQAREQLRTARAALEASEEDVRKREAACAELASAEELTSALESIRELRIRQDAIHGQLSRLPISLEREADPERAEKDESMFCRLRVLRTAFWAMGACFALAGIGSMGFFEMWLGILLTTVGAAFAAAGWICARRAGALLDRYDPVPPHRWAEDAAMRQAEQLRRERLYQELDDLRETVSELTGGEGSSEYEQRLHNHREAWNALEDARRERDRRKGTAEALEAACPQAQPPAEPDTLTCTLAQTGQLLSHCLRQQEQLQLQLGTCRGQMGALESEETQLSRLEGLNSRIKRLEDTSAALNIAQAALAEATEQLQRRFAPKITKAAQEIFSGLTGGRYERLTMDAELRLQTCARTEDTLRSSLWRSEGTADQLYLALRLAVARELTPQAPLVLDDALVRFDDERLTAALEVLQQEAQTRQVLLFTCQSREQAVLEKLSGERTSPKTQSL